MFEINATAAGSADADGGPVAGFAATRAGLERRVADGAGGPARRTHASDAVLPAERRGRWAITAPESTGITVPGAHDLDSDQRVIADLPAGCGPHLVLGAPGTGRSTAVLSLVVRRLREDLSPENLLVLTPSRSSAARTREILSASAGITMSTPPVRAWQAYAFDLLRRAQSQSLLEGMDRAPKLMSGPEQDVLIRELMEGHSQGVGAGVLWPDSLREAVTTRGFRQEMRELFDRLSEHDLSPDDLEELARVLQRPDWSVAAAFRREYLSIRRLRMPESFDPAALVTEAARVLERHPEFLAAEQQRLKLVIVEDLQEATRSIHRLLAVLCAGGDTVMTACPDTVVQGFRGARPDALRGLADRLGTPERPVHTHVLGHGHRMEDELHTAWQRVAQRIPAVTPHRYRMVSTGDTPMTGTTAQPTRDNGSSEHEAESGVESARENAWASGREGAGGNGKGSGKSEGNSRESAGASARGSLRESTPETVREAGENTVREGAASCPVNAVVLASGTHEARWIGHAVLERHLLHGVNLQDMAVIVRNGARLKLLQRHLEGLGIPVTTSAAETPVREEPAAKPLLAALDLVVAADRQDRAAQDDGSDTSRGLETVGGAGTGTGTDAETETGTGTDAGPDTSSHTATGPADTEPLSERPSAAHLPAEQAPTVHSRPEHPQAASHTALLEAEEAVNLLSSRIGGASAMDIRRLRQRLRYAEVRNGGGRSSDRLLVEALMAPGALDAAGVRSTPARRIARMLQAGRTALQQPNATAETVLWALWESSGVAGLWQKDALNGGEAGRRADRDLDAVVGLFEMAERFVDHLPGAGAAEFLDFLAHQELPMDTLAARAPSRATVEIMTPATAAGREWPVVFVAGVQEGQWPNTALRGQLLGADLLTDAVELGVEAAADTSPVTRLNLVRHDELRSFSTAVSRASRELVVTAVADQDQEPSEFLGLVDPWDVSRHPQAAEQARPVEKAPRPLTLRALTAQLRAAVQDRENPPVAEAAARLLHRLAQAETPVPGTDPSQWWGLSPLSSVEPVVDPEQPVPVSPSRIETITRSPLDWFVSTARAEEATDPARSLGTLVHSIAEQDPEAPSTKLLEDLERRWPELGLGENWETELLKERARSMLRKYATYVIEARKDLGRELATVEGSFSVLVKGGARDALLRGRVDRLEVDSHGRYVVVDLKTGTTQPKPEDVPTHPQLGAYQVALAAGAGEAILQATRVPDSPTPTEAAVTDSQTGADTHVAPESQATSGTVREATAETTPEATAGKAPDVVLELHDDGARVAEPGGAVLVQLGRTTKGYTQQSQEPLAPEDDWARQLVTAAADLVSGDRFLARHTAQNAGQYGGPRCRLPEICPLCTQGRQVTE